MNSQDLRNLSEAYNNVYEATGRDEMLAANIARARAPKPTTGGTVRTPGGPVSTPGGPVKTPTPGPVAQAPKPSGGLLGTLDKAARDTAGKVGEVIGREKAKSVPGANLPILGDVIKNEGGRRGRNQGQQMYDKAKETVGSLLKQDYEYDAFDIILEYLVYEGYADTNENALVIMANMSEEWRDGIVEGYKRYPAKKVGKKLDRMYNDPDNDTRFGKTGKRYSQMMTVDSHMKGEVHPLIRAYSPKKSKAKEAENRKRGNDG